MHEEASELIRLQTRLKRLNGTNTKPSPRSDISMGARSSRSAKQVAPDLPSLADERRARGLDLLDDEQTQAFQVRVEIQMTMAYDRIDKLRAAYRNRSL